MVFEIQSWKVSVLFTLWDSFLETNELAIKNKLSLDSSHHPIIIYVWEDFSWN